MLFNILFDVKYFDLEPSFFFASPFSLGIRGLLFALTMNLKAVPRFGDILHPMPPFPQFKGCQQSPQKEGPGVSAQGKVHYHLCSCQSAL